MKIYYYKQQQNTFALFSRKPSIRLRYILILGLAFFSLIAITAKLKHTPHRTDLTKGTSNSFQSSLSNPPLDAETEATSINIQNNFEQNSVKSDESLNSKETQQSKTPPSAANGNATQIVTVKPRDTLEKIFSRVGLSKKDIAALMHSSEQTQALKRLKPGQKIALNINNHQLQQLSYDIDSVSTLLINRVSGSEYRSLIKTANLEPKQTFAKFIVFNSINSSAKKAGLNSKRTSQLASIFKSSIDFSKGNHAGDKVCVLYQDYYANGKKIKDGDIIAAEVKTATNTYQAVRFTDPNGNSGYYAPDGTSMQKRFLPAPLKFTRISSLFNPNRWHPVLHRFRHHQGVDYAAPYGTPIKSVANGVIAHLGRKGGYGNTIMIKHDSSYSTLYGHLSKYASGLKVGSHVQQGQLIGYVGSSGLATGPHLHFEFKINGIHRNPLTVALPNGKSITHAYRNKFHNEVKKLLAKLDAHKHSNSG